MLFLFCTQNLDYVVHVTTVRNARAIGDITSYSEYLGKVFKEEKEMWQHS